MPTRLTPDLVPVRRVRPRLRPNATRGSEGLLCKAGFLVVFRACGAWRTLTLRSAYKTVKSFKWPMNCFCWRREWPA